MQAAVSNPTDRIARGGGRLLFNADGSVSLSLPAAVGLSQAGTAPVAVGSGTGTSAGTFHSIATPAGGASPNAGGGAGGAMVWTTGPGGAATSVTSGNGGTGGAHTITLGAGGLNTTGQGGVGGAYTYTTGVGGQGNSTQAGTGGVVSGSGGAGGAYTINTGAGGVGDGTAALSGAGGAGGLYKVQTGNGAAGANGGLNSSRGGNGGGVTYITGAGANGSNNGAGTGQGGAGGVYSYTAGVGGNGSQAGSGTGTGGAGGTYSYTAGAGGIGSATGSGTNTGGAGGTFTMTAGVGGAAAAGSGGAGGFYLWTAGAGGASTSTTGSVTGGAIGYFKFVGGNGGSSTNGNGGGGTNGSSIVILPVSSTVAGFVAQMGNGGSTTFATGTAGAGAGVYFLTGNAGTTPSLSALSKGGDYHIVLGTGNAVQDPLITPFSAGRNGQFQVWAPNLPGSTPYALSGFNTPTTPGATFIVSSLGIGIGTAAGLGTPVNLTWMETDPQHTVNGMSSGYLLTLTTDLGDFSMQSQAAGIHLFGPGAMTSTSGNGCTDDEFHVYSTATGVDGSGHPTGPNHAYIRGGYSKVHIENYSAATPFSNQIPTAAQLIANPSAAIPTPADVGLAYGNIGEVTHEGTGTINIAGGVYGSIVPQTTVNQGWRDPQITNAYPFVSHIALGGTQAAPFNTVIAKVAHFYAQSTTISGSQTGVVTSGFGFLADAQRNTANATTAITGLALVAGAAKFTVANQSATGGLSTTTVVNHGLYITGNGGTASGSASVINHALYSDSTAPSSMLGPLMLGATTNPTATSLTLADGWNVVVGSTVGTIFGTVGGAAGQKMGWWGAAPIVQPVFATGASHTVDQLITQLQTMGLFRQS